MKREFTAIVSVFLAIAVLSLPYMGGVSAYADTVMTTTMPLTTTTTGWDCISTPPPTTTTTTTTTLVLTGPDGTAPTTTMPFTTTTTGWDCISTPPPTTTTTTTTTWVLTGPDGTAPTTTTTATTVPQPSLCGEAVDLLSTADIDVSDTMAILGSPEGGNWLSVDCYSYDGGTISIVPTADRSICYPRRYFHITIIANVPFRLSMTEEMTTLDGADWAHEANVNEDGTIQAGAYVLSANVDSVFEYANAVNEVTVTLIAPGSVTVGHIALSDQAVCGESAPRIQTTTRPTFPWDQTTLPSTTTTTWVLTGTDSTAPTADTTTTHPTTNPTVGDVLLPGDIDGDGFVSSSDARMILIHCIESMGLDGDGDYNGDGVVSTLDVRLILKALTA